MLFLDNIVGELLGPKSVGELSKSVGADSGQVEQLVKNAIPLLLSGMRQNASTEDGAQSLAKALDAHAPNAEKSTSAMLRKADAKDGQKIIQHILGGSEKEVTQKLAKSTGLSQSQVTSLLSQLAPVVLSLVGNYKNEGNGGASSSPNLFGLLGSALMGDSSQEDGGNKPNGGLNIGGLLTSLLK